MITFKNLCQIDLYVNMKVSNFFLPVCLLVRTEGEWMKPSWWRPKRISTALLGFQSFSKWQVPGYHLTNHSRDVKFKILFDTLFPWNQFSLWLTDKTLIKIQSPSPQNWKKKKKNSFRLTHHGIQIESVDVRSVHAVPELDTASGAVYGHLGTYISCCVIGSSSTGLGVDVFTWKINRTPFIAQSRTEFIGQGPIFLGCQKCTVSRRTFFLMGNFVE